MLSSADWYLHGHVLRSLFSHRSGKLFQSPEICNYGQEKFRRTNTYDAYCGDPKVKGRVMTVQYAIHSYGAGAAHPNCHFETFSFVLEPLTQISSLEEIFVNPSEALTLIQAAVRAKLLTKSADDSGVDTFGLDKDWVERGTETWSDLGAFMFSETEIDFLFAPYQVSSYANGSQFAEVQYEAIVHLIRSEFKSALGIEHLS